jgi:hypothetical protein
MPAPTGRKSETRTHSIEKEMHSQKSKEYKLLVTHIKIHLTAISTGWAEGDG